MRLFILFTMLVMKSLLAECKATYRHQDKQDERTNGGNVCKRCFLERVRENIVKPVNKNEDTEVQVNVNTNKTLTNNQDKISNSYSKLKRKKRSCWYVFNAGKSGNPSFTIRCKNNTDNTMPVTPTEMTGDGAFAKLLSLIGYEVYTDQGNIHVNTKRISEVTMVNENMQKVGNRGQKLTSAEKKKQSFMIGGRRKKRKQKPTKGMTSAEKKRAKKKRQRRKSKKGHKKRQDHMAGGISASSIWSSVPLEPKPTVGAGRVLTTKRPRSPLTTRSGQTSVTKWWNGFKWLFNTSVIITLPDGTHWYFPDVAKQPVPVTTVPPVPTPLPREKITHLITTENTMPVTTKTPIMTTLAAKSTAPKKPTPLVTGANYPVFGVSPSHEWFPDLIKPTYRWYADGARPTESHTWFTDKKDPSKDHKWFGQQTHKPVTSHNWFQDTGDQTAESHKWHGQEGNIPSKDETYWWFGSAIKLFLPEDDFDPKPLLSKTFLQKFLKNIEIDILPK
ncbi:uncharacterized protein [Antedon mediterranea]|uniref:uncharacterized protein n=1 Tax=Antedon mediterranea TaxID=105859 RepID=UPI003AF84968